MTNKTIKEVTLQELVTAFEGKHTSIFSSDCNGISISMHKAMLEYEPESGELYFVNRDKENKVMASFCVGRNSIKSIEKYDNKYTINFNLDISSVDVRDSIF